MVYTRRGRAMHIHKKRKIAFRTIASIIIITLLLIGIHMYFNLSIQARTNSDDWSRSVKIGEGENNWNPLIGDLGDSLLTATFNKDGSLNYFLVDKSGNLIKDGKIDKENIRITNKKNVALAQDKLCYISNNNLYLSVFDSEKGFLEPKVILNNVEKFSLNIVEDRIVLQSFNEDKIFISEVINNELKDIVTLDNTWNTYKVVYNVFSGQEEVFIVHKSSRSDVETVRINIENGKALDSEKLDNKQISVNASINDFEISYLDGKYYIFYETTQVAGGSRSVYGELRIIDRNTLEADAKTYIMDGYLNGITKLGEDYTLFKGDSGIQIIATAQNLMDKYSVSPDIFILTVHDDGTLSEPEFISSSEAYTIKPSIINTDEGQYVIFLDIITGGQYSLNIISDNDSFKVTASGYTRDDYKAAFLKAITAPIFALSYIVMRTGIVNLVYVVFAFLVVYLIIKSLGIRNEKIKSILFILAYIGINIWRFDNNFYVGASKYLMPEILTMSIMMIVVPLLINLVSGLITFIFYREFKRFEYFTYIVFFIAIDLYLSNLLYAPFDVIKTLAQ